MTLADFLESAKRRWSWLAAIFVLCLVLAAALYGAMSDHYAIDAVVTAKSGEDHNIDAASISGLAALAGGGKRPSFEQFAYLINSDEVVRTVIPAVRRDSPELAEEFLGQSSLGRIRANFENGARALFGKDPVVVDPTDRLIAAIDNRLKVTKTPEGYLRIDFVAGTADGQVALLRLLLEQADLTVRERERTEYAARVSTYRGLIDLQGPTTERSILVALIGREYSDYVTAQSGPTFSYHFVEQPRTPRRVYSTGLLTLMLVAGLMAVCIWLAAVAIDLWWRRRC